VRAFPAAAGLVLALGLVLSVPGAPARAGGEAPRARREDLVAALAALADWCAAHDLAGRADDVAETVLRAAPDDEAAHRRLGHRRDADGRWVPDPARKRPADRAEKAVPEYERRLAAALDAHLAAAREAAAPSALHEDFERGVEELVLLRALRPLHRASTTALRDALLGRLLALKAAGRETEDVEERVRRALPDDPDARAALGDVLLDGRYVLGETAAAAARRATLAKAVAAALESARDAAPAGVHANEHFSRIDWKAGLEAPGGRPLGIGTARVLGTVEEDEARRAAVGCAAAPTVVAALVDDDLFGFPRFTVYLLPGKDDLPRLVKALGIDPGLGGQARFLDRLASVWLDPDSVAVVSTKGDFARVDCAVHLAADRIVRRAFFRPRVEPKAWVSNGLGIYATWRILGTRISVTVGGEYRAWEEPNRPAGDDWLRRARDLLRKGSAPSLRLALGKAYDGFSGEDLLVSWAFTSWLVEARPAAVRPLLAALGEGASLDDAFARAFSAPPEVVERRLLRWVEETVGP
jgi:hypothetical protein